MSEIPSVFAFCRFLRDIGLSPVGFCVISVRVPSAVGLLLSECLQVVSRRCKFA